MYSKLMIDVALIYPPWAVLDDRSILQNSLPPLGILSIASYLESKNYTVKIYDIHGQKLEEEDFLDLPILEPARPRLTFELRQQSEFS